MQLCTVSSALVIGWRKFALIRGTRSRVIRLIIYYETNVEYILMMNILIKQTVRNLSGQIFIGLLYAAKISEIIILLSLFGKLFLWNGANGGLMRFYYNLWHITTVF